jgi:hypothetical protein
MMYAPTYVLCNTIVVLTIEKPGRVVVVLCSSVHCAGVPRSTVASRRRARGARCCSYRVVQQW